MGWTMAAVAVVQGITQIQQGRAAKREADYNATLLEGKAQLIDVQKGIEKQQYITSKARALSSGISSIAGSGIQASGSPIAVMLENQRQMSLDQEIGQFNLEQEKRYTIAEAESIRRKGKQALKTAYTNAFTTMLQGGSNYAQYKGYFNTSSGATKAK